MRIKYIEKSFKPAALATIESANNIIGEYQRAGYTLTLRQLYYQFVSRDLIENTVQSYKRIGEIICDARLAGLIDWDAIEDRTRNLSRLSTWDDPADIIGACARQFRLEVWASQPNRVEVWIEKEALAGVFERACNEFDVPFFCCRGYTSASEVWSAAMRFKGFINNGQKVVILHFGDHDPSGMDMSRDIESRLDMFGVSVEFRRLALNMDQIRQYVPPPNPAKKSDSRFKLYRDTYGDESWELDALEPRVLADLVKQEVKNIIHRGEWDQVKRRQSEARAAIRGVADRWEDVCDFLLDEDGKDGEDGEDGEQ